MRRDEGSQVGRPNLIIQKAKGGAEQRNYVYHGGDGQGGTEGVVSSYDNSRERG